MIPDNLNTIAAVTGMVVLAVLMASLVTRYQQSQQQRRARIRQLLAGAQQLEDLLQLLAGIPLPRDARSLLRRDILARYRAVQRVHRGYPGVGRLIRQRAQRLDSEGPDAAAALPVAPNPQTFHLWIVGLHEVIEIIRYGRLLEPVPLPTRNGVLQSLLEREAECLYGHHMHEVDKLKQAGRVAAARHRIQHLQEQIRMLGVRSDRISQLLDETEQAYQYLLHGPAAMDAAVAGG